jgi:hypothetical protein
MESSTKASAAFLRPQDNAVGGAPADCDHTLFYGRTHQGVDFRLMS